MNVLDTNFAIKSTPIRKILALVLQMSNIRERLFPNSELRHTNPPLLINSIPKSGTHLLMQIVRSMKGSRYFGSFIAQTPSVTLRRRGPKEICWRLNMTVPSEVLGAHLYYCPLVDTEMSKIPIRHFLIIRDPVDILLSEVHYLAYMNKYHRMHSLYKGLNQHDRLDLALNGSKVKRDLYPSFHERIEPYLGWLECDHVKVVRYESLICNIKLKPKIEEIIRFASDSDNEHSLSESVYNESVVSAIASISPKKSHTFSGRSSDPQLTRFLASELKFLRERMGYH